jgi:hypothetical protein
VSINRERLGVEIPPGNRSRAPILE